VKEEDLHKYYKGTSCSHTLGVVHADTVASCTPMVTHTLQQVSAENIITLELRIPYRTAVPPAVTCAVAVAFGIAVDITRSTGTKFAAFLSQVVNGRRRQSH